MRSLLARNETARFTTISGFKSYIFLINQSFWTGSLCFSNRKYTKIADSSKKSADIHYHVNKNTVLLIWCVALGQYIVPIDGDSIWTEYVFVFYAINIGYNKLPTSFASYPGLK